MRPLVEVDGLQVAARDRRGRRRRSLVSRMSASTLAPGEVVALIGEFGSGKTTIALSLMGYARAGCRIAGGRVRFGDTPNVLALSRRELATLHGSEVAYIPQSAAAAFNPAKPLMTQVVESARIHGTLTVARAQQKAKDSFDAPPCPIRRR